MISYPKHIALKKQILVWLVGCAAFLCTTVGYTQTTTDTIPAWQYFTKADSLLTERKLDSAVVYFEKALPIYEKVKAWEQVARCYNKISESQWRMDKYEESFINANKALKISDEYLKNNNLEEAYAYNSIGNVFFSKEEYHKALSYYKKSLKIKEGEFEIYNLNISTSFFNIGLIHYYTEEYDLALSYLNKALSVKKKKLNQNDIKLANSYRLIGRCYDLKGEYNKALPYLKKYLTILIHNYGEEHYAVINAYNAIGILYKNLGEYNMALYHYDLAIDIINRLDLNKIPKKNMQSLKAIYNNTGIVYKYKGEYDKALRYIKKSLHIGIEDSLEVAINYNNIGAVYRVKADYDQSLFYAKKALRIWTKNSKGYNSDIADSYNDIGELYYAKKSYTEAIEYNNRALKIRIKVFGNNSPYVADSYTNLADSYRNKREYSIALENYTKALVIRQNIFGAHHPKVASLYNNLARLFWAQNNFKKALVNYDKAIVANNISNTHTNQYLDQNILLTTLHDQANTYKKLFQESKSAQDLTKAIATYQKADTIINTIRQTFTNYEDKVRFAQKAKDVYQGAIEAQLFLFTKQNDRQALENAFYYSEKSKSNTLKELLAASNAKNFTGLPEDVVTLEKELRINHAYYQSKITESFASAEIDSSKVRDYENKLFGIKSRQDSLTQVLERNYPKYYELKHQDKIVSVSELQKNLNEQTTILEFFTSDSITYAFMVSKQNIGVKELNTKDLTNHIEQLRAAITSKSINHYKSIAHQLYTALIDPVKDQFVGDELIIIPDGPLWHLNFELLLTQNDASNNPKELSYLLKEYAVSYANSANLLFTKSKEKNSKTKRQECLAFSFSDSTQITDNETMSMSTLRDTGDDLPGTRKEIRAISDIIDGQYYYGSQAIEANFKKNANQYNILHLALHGDVDHERPENSKLYFTKSKDTIEDNLLYGHELFALDIPAELTVLSACNTGTGKIAKGEGIMSLGSAFQYAGTKSLLLSSWEVSDQTTPALMKYFYTHLKEGMNKAKALQQAKLQYLNTANINRTHPFYWGGFYLVGDAAAIQFDDYTKWYWILGILIVMLVLGGLFIYRRKIGI